MRLDKYLTSCFIGTRSEVKKIIKSKKITVNNKIILQEGFNVDELNDIVKYDNKVLIYQKYYYYVLNKPSNYVTSTDDPLNKTIMELFNDLPTLLIKELFPVGRLDKDTEGMIIVTNDGSLSHYLTSPNQKIEKTYYVEYDGILVSNAIELASNGITTQNESFLPATLSIINEHSCYLTIKEGKYHQVKKMIHEMGGILTYLKRIKINNLELPLDLEIGKYRHLTNEEIEILKK